MDLRSKRIRRPLQFGRIVHDLCEVFLEGGDPLEKLEEIEESQGQLFREEVEEYGNIVDDIEVIFSEYMDYWRDDPLIPIPVDGHNAEHQFEIEVETDITFTGRLDFLCQTKGGRTTLRWLGEHKTFNQLPNEDHRWKDLQSAVYFRAIDMLGWIGKHHLDGVCWDYIHSKPPKQPQLLKKGGLSTRKLNTLPSVIVRAARENNVPIKDVTDLLDHAEEHRHEYFKRIYTPINQEVVDYNWNGFLDTAHEILDNRGKNTQQTIGRHCEWCDYEAICRARMLGHDADFVIETQYQVVTDDQEKHNVQRDKIRAPAKGSDAAKSKPVKKKSRSKRTRQATR
jgi:hypothetical protein